MKSVKVFVFSGGFGLPTMGPFALKLELWLKMAGIEYERVYEDDTRKGPKGKNPWIEIDGERMGDTELIIDRLERDLGLDLESHLSPSQRAQSLAIQRMVEEHLHQIVEYELFLHPHGWEVFSANFEGILPPVVGPLIKVFLKSNFRKQLYARGIGRHSPDAIAAMGRKDLQALSVLIGDGPFIFGEKPSLVDASVFGQLAVLRSVPANAPMMTYVREDDVLRNYCDRILERYFSSDLPIEEASGVQREVS